MKFVASRLSGGNKIFPAEIYLEPSGVTLRFPGLFKGETKHFDYAHIASVEIDTPLIGFSSITLFAGGTQMMASGFTKAEVKQIKEGIEKGKLAAKNTSSNDSFSASAPASSSSSAADELKKLKELLDMGALTPEEFDQQKKKILGL